LKLRRERIRFLLACRKADSYRGTLPILIFDENKSRGGVSLFLNEGDVPAIQAVININRIGMRYNYRESSASRHAARKQDVINKLKLLQITASDSILFYLCKFLLIARRV